MAPVTIVYFCYGWTLWLYLNWLPSYFLHEYNVQITSRRCSRRRSFRGRRRRLSRRHHQRSRSCTRPATCRRRAATWSMIGFSRLVRVPAAGLPHARSGAIISVARRRVFLRRARDRTDVVDPDGHRAASFRGRRAGMMNTGSALAAILSPVAFGVHHRPDRQLATAVRRLAGPAAPRRRAGADDAPGTRRSRRPEIAESAYGLRPLTSGGFRFRGTRSRLRGNPRSCSTFRPGRRLRQRRGGAWLATRRISSLVARIVSGALRGDLDASSRTACSMSSASTIRLTSPQACASGAEQNRPVNIRSFARDGSDQRRRSRL